MAKRILVCDDEKFIRWALAEHLRNNGFIVDEAEDGEECVNKIAALPPDAVFLDLRMPKMDGETALRILRDKGFKAPVFILSGFGETLTPKDIEEMGASRYIAKPYDLSQIMDALRSTIETN